MNTSSVDILCSAVDQVYSQISIPKIKDKARLEEQDLWQELSCCILSSQVNYELALSAAQAIGQSGLLSLDDRSWQVMAKDLYSILNGTFDLGGRSLRYRFPTAKSLQIARTWATIRDQSQTLIGLLAEFEDMKALREWLVQHAPGVGPKQASMFLRNAGLTFDLAVLDRHVLHYMEVIELLQGDQRPASSLRAYQETESTLRNYANELGYSVGILDWAIWIVMRVANSTDLAMERTT